MGAPLGVRHPIAVDTLWDRQPRNCGRPRNDENPEPVPLTGARLPHTQVEALSGERFAYTQSECRWDHHRTAKPSVPGPDWERQASSLVWPMTFLDSLASWWLLAFSKAGFTQGPRLLLISLVRKSKMVPRLQTCFRTRVPARIPASICPLSPSNMNSSVFLVHFHVAGAVPGSAEGPGTSGNPNPVRTLS